MYSAIDLSKHIVSKCFRDDCPISNMQLQKILYSVQKNFLKQGKRAFADEIEAWEFGPVVPNVYYKFCGSGSMPITTDFQVVDIEKEDLTLIDRIVEEKRLLPPWDLAADICNLNSAWSRAYRKNGRNHNVISIDLIKEENRLVMESEVSKSFEDNLVKKCHNDGISDSEIEKWMREI